MFFSSVWDFGWTLCTPSRQALIRKKKCSSTEIPQYVQFYCPAMEEDPRTARFVHTQPASRIGMYRATTIALPVAVIWELSQIKISSVLSTDRLTPTSPASLCGEL
jgi:hypothetical protein